MPVCRSTVLRGSYRSQPKTAPALSIDGEQAVEDSSKDAPDKDAERAMSVRAAVKQLFEAALEGRLDEIKGIAPSVTEDGLSSVRDANGRTALHFAAQGGNKAVVQFLLEVGSIDINISDNSGIMSSISLLNTLSPPSKHARRSY